MVDYKRADAGSKDEPHGYEIDFLLSRGAKLHPIEVKSSGYKTHKSLDVFCQKYSHIVDNRYLIYTKDLKKDEEASPIHIKLGKEIYFAAKLQIISE